MFIISAIIYCIGALSAILLSSAEVEPWAKKTPIQRKTEKSLKNLKSLGIHLDLAASGIDINNLRSANNLASVNKIVRIATVEDAPGIEKKTNVLFDDPRFTYDK